MCVCTVLCEPVACNLIARTPNRLCAEPSLQAVAIRSRGQTQSHKRRPSARGNFAAQADFIHHVAHTFEQLSLRWANYNAVLFHCVATTRVWNESAAGGISRASSLCNEVWGVGGGKPRPECQLPSLPHAFEILNDTSPKHQADVIFVECGFVPSHERHGRYTSETSESDRKP